MDGGSFASARLAVLIAGAAMVVFLCGVSQNQPTSIPGSVPSAEKLIQIVMRDLEAEEMASGELDEYVRGQVSQAWVYLGRDSLAIENAQRGSEFWRAVNLAGVVQTQARLTGHKHSPAGLAALNVPEENAWLLPLSIADGFLESDRTSDAHQALESVPVNRGALPSFIRVLHRLCQQLLDDGSVNGLRKVLPQTAKHVEDHFLHPTEELYLALLTRLAMQSRQPDIAERFRRQAIAVSDKYQPQDVPNSLPYSAFATLQGALACFEVGDVNESRTRIELAIRQAEQIISGESVSERDIRERSVTLEKLARRLQEFELPVEALQCLERSASHTAQLEGVFGRDAQFRDLTVTAHDLGHHDLAGQFEARIETPSWKLVALRDQIERLRTSGRTTEARARLLAAEDQLPNILELSSRIGEIAELGAAWTRLGDWTRGREHFQRALRLSEQNDQSDHQSIARLQIKVGRLNEAFATTQQMTERKYRILPLTELAVAAATKQFEQRQASKIR